MAAQRSSRERDGIIAQPPQQRAAVKVALAGVMAGTLTAAPLLRLCNR